MSTPRPNVLLLMSDQHHAGIMSCAGDRIVQTPALDDLAARGVRFTNAYCPFPLCGPSRMSFMTCRHPFEIGLWDNQSELASSIPTFAHAFLASGYDTVLSGRMHFSGHDQRHGFVERTVGDVPESAYLVAGWKLARVLGTLVDTPGCSLPGLLKSGPGRTGYQAYDELVTQRTVAWLEQRGRVAADRPFLLTVGYAAPHCPFVAPPEDFERYAQVITSAHLPAPGANHHPVNAQRRKWFQTDVAPPLDAQWRTRVAYYGLCSFLDRQVGTVLRALEGSGLAGNTIVVYTSDHGEMLGEHGMWWKSTFYDGACRVPLLVAWPGGGAGGQVVTQNVSLMDIGPTVLDLAGVAPLPGASGRSCRALLAGDAHGGDDTVFAEHTDPVSRMVRSGPWKYNYYHGHRPELFNLQEDPQEQTDLAASPACQPIRERLHDLALQRWNPDQVTEGMDRLAREQQLLASWVRAAQPVEPDPLWFDEPLENGVDNTRVCAPPHGQSRDRT